MSQDAPLKPSTIKRVKITIVLEDEEPTAQGYVKASMRSTFEPVIPQDEEAPRTAAMNMLARMTAAIRPFSGSPEEQEKERAARAEALAKAASALETPDRPALKLIRNGRNSKKRRK
jgi:hypothetical protein